MAASQLAHQVLTGEVLEESTVRMQGVADLWGCGQ